MMTERGNWQMNATRFVALDSWRGVCALLVAIHNLDEHWIPQPDFVIHSSLFVDFFFVLSGFVITHAYGDKLTNFPEVGAFLLRRFGRLWPLHVVMMAALIGMSFLKLALAHFFHYAFELASAPISMRMIAANLFLVQTIDIPSRLTINAPSWSISTEIWTYFLFSGICLYCEIRRRSATVISGGFVLLSIGVLFLFSPQFLATNTDYAFFRCFYGFFVGHLVYKVWKTSPIAIRNEGIAETLIIGIIIVFVQITGNGIASMAAPVVFGLAVLIFAQQRGYLSKLLMMRPFVQLGTWSYSIYMVHWLVRRLFSRTDEIVGHLTGRQALPNSAFLDNVWTVSVALVGYLVLVVILAAVSYRLIEQPGRRLFNRMAVDFRLQNQNRRRHFE
jgi:peptidoglycan/LPS O-acetylase OafA/YrhL